MSNEKDFAWTHELQAMNQKLEQMRQLFAHIRGELHWQPFTVSCGIDGALPVNARLGRCLLRGIYAANDAAVTLVLTDGAGGAHRLNGNALPISGVRIFFAHGITIASATGSGEVFFYGEALE